MNAANFLAPVIVLAASVPAQATPAVKLAYDAPSGCPSEDDFVAAVTARGADFDAHGRTVVAEVMVVSITRAQDGFAGAFQVRDGGEATNKREVRGASCREVADALAVVTAIALQADASAGSGEAPVTPLSPPPGAADSQPSSAAAPAAAPPPPDSARLRAHTIFRPPTTVTVPAGTVHFDFGSTVNVNAGATVGLIPSLVLPQYDLSIVVAPFVTTPDGAQRIHGVIWKLDGGIWGPATYGAADTKTNIWGVYTNWSVCLSPTYDTEGLVVLFCFGGGGGELALNTSAPNLSSNPPGLSTNQQYVGFADVQASAGLQYYLGAGFHIGAEIRGAAVVGDIHAERADGSRVFSSSPTYSAEFLLGLGYHPRWHR
jgi:hypothetical protein